MTTVKAECKSCGGTGLYCGFAEPKGTAVICLTCKGSGCEEITYTPFTGPKEKKNIQTVKKSAGTFIVTGIGPIESGKGCSYSDFKSAQLIRFQHLWK